MSQAGEEMILALASLLSTSTVKTAAKKEKEDKPCKCGEKDCDCGCKGDSDKCKCEKKEDKDDKKKDKGDKKSKKEKCDCGKPMQLCKGKCKKDAMMGILSSLVKLASELDDAGADQASGLVDDAIRVIVNTIEKKK